MIFWIFFETFPIGITSYVEYPVTEISEPIFWTSLHQIWFLPFIYLVIYFDFPNSKFGKNEWVLSSLIGLVFSVFEKFSKKLIKPNYGM